MPQDMRRYFFIDPRFLGLPDKKLADISPAQSAQPSRYEKWSFVIFALLEIKPNPLERPGREKYRPLFVAFADNLCLSPFKVHAVSIKRQGFRDTNTGPKQHLD